MKRTVLLVGVLLALSAEGSLASASRWRVVHLEAIRAERVWRTAPLETIEADVHVQIRVGRKALDPIPAPSEKGATFFIGKDAEAKAVVGGLGRLRIRYETTVPRSRTLTIRYRIRPLASKIAASWL